MGRKYKKGEELSDAIRARNAAGETNRAIGESYGLSKRQVEQLISRQNRKGRPRKEAASEEVRQHNELAKLRMQVELLQNFLSEAGCQQAIYKYSNLLNRRFDQPRPNQFWGADITCIPFPSGMLYMGAVLDLCGKVVQNWKIGSEMSSSLVTNTIREALQQEKVTDKVYFDLTQVYHASPSMFSHGCPCDNAAVENFFGALKTECLYRARFSLRAEVERLVTESVHFYNFECISLKNGLTPLEIRGKTA